MRKRKHRAAAVCLLLAVWMISGAAAAGMQTTVPAGTPASRAAAKTEAVSQASGGTGQTADTAESALPEEDQGQAELLSEVTGSCGDNLSWTLDDTGLLTIAGSGDMYDMLGYGGSVGISVGSPAAGVVPWYDLREEITSVSIASGVTGIGNSAFVGCINLSEADIPDSVARIGSAAFSGCVSLEFVRIPDAVSEIGKGAFNGCSGLVEIEIPSRVTSIAESVFAGCGALKEITVPEGVTAIGGSAFSGCGSLSAVSLPDSLTSIGSNAFANCAALTEIIIPDRVAELGSGAFNGCGSMVSARIGSGVTTIGARAWENCGSLTEITLPAGLSDLGNYVWNGCGSLQAINVQAGGAAYKSADGVLFSSDGEELIRFPQAKQGAYSIPAGVVSIRESAFLDCAGVTAISIPEGVTVIPSDAFRDCSAMTSVSIPDGVTAIRSRAFENSALQTLDLPDTVTEIELWAFRNCGGLKTLDLPEQISSLSIGAFGECSGLTEVSVPAGAENISFHYVFTGCGNLTEVDVDEANEAFCSAGGVVFSRDRGVLIFCPRGKQGSYSIPDGVTSVADSAFQYCSGLTEIEIPDSVTVIEAEAFEYCSGLTKVTIPDSVTELGGRAFSYCENLEEIVMPGGVTEIETGLFEGCGRLSKVILSERTERIGDRAFALCSGLTEFAIPAGVVSVGNSAFEGCGGLKEITIPAAASDISMVNCFSKCAGLERIDIAEGNSTCCSVDGLVYSKDRTELIRCPAGRQGSCSVPEGTVRIGNGAFDGCAGLTGVILPEGVSEIGDYAFHGCSALKEAELPDSLTSIGTNAFGKCVALEYIAVPDGVTEIGSYAFDGCDALTGAEIPESVSSIPARAFQDCGSLEDVSMPEGLTEIGEYAFSSCTSLQSVNIPETTVSIQQRAFQSCSSLADVSIPDSVGSIGSYAFYECRSLSCVSIANGNTSIGRCAFKDCAGLRDVFYGGTGAEWDENGDITTHRANLFSSEDYDSRMETEILLEDVPGGVAVTMYSTGQQIYYTLDGSIPGTSSIPYEGTFLLDEEGEYFINARAFDLAAGTCGEIGMEYLYLEQSDAPKIRESGDQVIISSEGDVYYTLDAAEIPTMDDYLYTEPLRFSETSCVRARVFESGKAPGRVVSYVWYKPTGEGFAYTDDSYRFENNRESFGYTGVSYRISKERYEEVFGGSFGDFLYDIYGDIGWGGSCFGMSATALMFYRNLLPLEEYSENAGRVYDLQAPASKDSALTKLIERYQIAQFSDEVMMERDDPSEGGSMVLSGQKGNGEEGAALLDAVRSSCSGGNAVILILWRNNLDGSHAVVPYRLTDDAIYVYDCNEPGAENKIGYSISDSGAYRFSYGQYSYAVSLNRVSTLLESIGDIEAGASALGEEDMRMLVSVNTDDITLRDAQGREVTDYRPYRTVDADAERFVFSVPAGSYIINSNDETPGELIVSAATETDYYTVTLDDPASTVELSERYGRLAMSVSADHPVSVQCSASNSSGRTNTISAASAYLSVYACTDRAILVDSTSGSMVSNGMVMAMQQKEQSDGLFAASVVSGYTTGARKAYEGSRNCAVTTDLSVLPDADAALTAYVSGAPDHAVLRAAFYTENGKLLRVRTCSVENGRKKYVFNTGGDAAEIRLFLLDRDTGKPLSDPAAVMRGEG